MNPDLARLQPYPFDRLNRLKAGLTPPAGLAHIALSIGEPQHPAPALALEALTANLGALSSYPLTRGGAPLREAIARWASVRYDLPPGLLDPERQVLPVNGTREALFAIAQAVVARGTPAPLVLMPNPFYQIYEGAALLAGAEPYYLDTPADSGFLPDYDALPAAVWERCQLLYLCSPGNPAGAVTPLATLERLLALADAHDFVIAADECYSEIHFDDDAPPIGLLEACARLGRHDFARCLVFNSLSKRSSLPGLRSGFVAGDAALIEGFLRYRTYHGCAMPGHTQAASVAAWNDEAHVVANRALYRAKLDATLDILAPVLEVPRPAAGFFLWPRTPLPGSEFARRLFAAQNVTVLPGEYLARDGAAGNPGAQRVRIALVAPLAACVEAAERIRRFVATL
ncbi:succinyldiaminopimelate aminotransferase [Plasticicumulans lactativorans]|uniref:Succinyldiaminopimelate aminotransferase n=1 Tax=Plasticicumulans lactativorans TaxID=1133106 RepID=A0A4R2L1L4_9GAMM|nr:succinyldiaminopimelate transaminase [Plasticicumulans lactativorans]TCO80921.1 succinyldiaminopimelate aminotransferase [Plasticicumulans lactativorans]